jgi:hypothetical protein
MKPRHAHSCAHGSYPRSEASPWASGKSFLVAHPGAQSRPRVDGRNPRIDVQLVIISWNFATVGDVADRGIWRGLRPESNARTL